MNLVCPSASVPILLFVAALTLLFGQDHPAGAWSERHSLPATAIAIAHGHHVHVDADEKFHQEKGLEDGDVLVHPVEIESMLDVAVNESLTWPSAVSLLASPLTWLPALAYLTTFGLVGSTRTIR
jgi:NNP family nitrate/nitrite transporter-like MFS transporter